MSVEPPSSQADRQLTYGDYLRIRELLRLQSPLSSPMAHDELLFIIIHQTYELWFKLLLHELDAVVVNLRATTRRPDSQDEVYEAARLLRRCTEIARLLVEQFTVLETMLPTHFLAFRDRLRPASGFQSEQFRELEFLCGLKDERMLDLHEPAPELFAALPSGGCRNRPSAMCCSKRWRRWKRPLRCPGRCGERAFSGPGSDDRRGVSKRGGAPRLD